MDQLVLTVSVIAGAVVILHGLGFFFAALAGMLDAWERKLRTEVEEKKARLQEREDERERELRELLMEVNDLHRMIEEGEVQLVRKPVQKEGRG